MSERWGPWIAHDGNSCPIRRGQIAEIVWSDGTSWSGMNEGQSAQDAGIDFVGGYNGPRYSSSWVWVEDGTKIPVARYRIRKPDALTKLEGLIADLPEEVDA